ncbi:MULTISPECIES: murein hydrolase activator EnvC [unclassified Nitratiruptor]|uniref:murein hydrolase activator EnvC family protein n=1 Tax=unclassified Nitratiruptor TaxID=2624044 RepID=UPI00191650D4|nr:MULTISPECIES: peptidoglycan DD-metalloendopeptidase family protein [unclassified Nitratiruptor]BCD60522.1 membrane-bound metallopeptidase [Nitratiruptor sp. YY08-10]BCD63989.1 membrane-bound metallopeptidase [Nitratiruptor sp. YY08-14]
MRVLVIFLSIVIGVFGTQIEKKITASKSKLIQTSKKISGVNITLAKLARSIRKLKSDLSSIDTQLSTLSKKYEKLSKQYQEKQKASQDLNQSIHALREKEMLLRQNLVLLISQNFSKSLLLSSINQPTQEDILDEEALKAIDKIEKGRIEQMGSEYEKTKRKLQEQQEKLTRLQQEIQQIIALQMDLKRLKKQKQEKIKALSKKKQRYDEELQALMEQKRSLAKTLSRLQILQRKRSSKAKNVTVKKYGSNSYKKIKTVRYRGPKTIPPLKHFVIVKKFGVYKDPIYNIEIPNENIELKPLKPNAKVRNVLSGKIVLAKWTPHLKNVVIVQNRNNIYTIYAYLDKLAPYIKKGRRIKKGYILGRVNTKLIFEVTKNDAHINPLQLIKIR